MEMQSKCNLNATSRQYKNLYKKNKNIYMWFKEVLTGGGIFINIVLA